MERASARVWLSGLQHWNLRVESENNNESSISKACVRHQQRLRYQMFRSACQLKGNMGLQMSSKNFIIWACEKSKLMILWFECLFPPQLMLKWDCRFNSIKQRRWTLPSWRIAINLVIFSFYCGGVFLTQGFIQVPSCSPSPSRLLPWDNKQEGSLQMLAPRSRFSLPKYWYYRHELLCLASAFFFNVFLNHFQSSPALPATFQSQYISFSHWIWAFFSLFITASTSLTHNISTICSNCWNYFSFHSLNSFLCLVI